MFNFRHNSDERSLDISPHWCNLSNAGEFSLGRHSVKKILMIAILAATPLLTLASQESSAQPQATPDTSSKSVTNTHHARRHHKRTRNSHHVKRHRASKQHSQPA